MERHGTQRRLRRVTIPCNWNLMTKWLIINIFGLIFFLQLMKYFLFYIHYKICKHSSISIIYIASDYERFDNHPYLKRILKYVCMEIVHCPALV